MVLHAVWFFGVSAFFLSFSFCCRTECRSMRLPAARPPRPRGRFADWADNALLDALAFSGAVRNCPGDNCARRLLLQTDPDSGLPVKGVRRIGEMAADWPDYRRSMCNGSRNRDCRVLGSCEAETGDGTEQRRFCRCSDPKPALCEQRDGDSLTHSLLRLTS